MSPMARRQRSDDSARGLGPTRTRVLALLQDSGVPMTAAASASQLGLHVNSVRFHLDALVADGLAVRTREDRSSPGRPQLLYAPSAGAPPVAHRSYRLLSEMLTSFIADTVPDPAVAAERIGRAWGRVLAPDGPSTDHDDATDVADPADTAGPAEATDTLRTLVDTLDGIGFDSHVVRDAGHLDLHVSHCPFLEVAEQHHDVVCSVHLGLMRGILEQRGGGLRATGLEPLVEPSLCIAHLRS
jgi:predicted ArsR family transcriptional regulator